MNRHPTAIAVFVKTPGLTPVKTRLAASLGIEAAEEFYRLSVAAIEATVARAAELSSFSPYWAIAEPDGLDHALWIRFPRLAQGEGSLGDRIHRVFSRLLVLHRAVVVIGADSPQITVELLQQADRYLNSGSPQRSYIVGRCRDGGFYVFGANCQVPEQLWKTISLGTSSAAEELATSLMSHGMVRELPILSDVDRAEDLVAVCTELRAISRPTAAQLAVLEWAATNSKGPPSA